jgi:hypothetical protein
VKIVDRILFMTIPGTGFALIGGRIIVNNMLNIILIQHAKPQPFLNI